MSFSFPGRALVFAFVSAVPFAAWAQLTPDTEKAIDAIVSKQLAASGEPSVSIAVAKNGKLAYAQAYGNAQLNPNLPATPQMRYKIGSVTKQFVAAAMLLLVEDGKLSMDDKVARFFPQLSGARDITLRQLLNHTAGYVDYYPLDIQPAAMGKAITADAIMNRYGKQPLQFKPGTRWDYSNTNYVIAGRIIEKASGMPLDQFMRTRIAAKLGLDSVVDVDRVKWSAADAAGYERNASGPLRQVTSEGKGWAFAAGHFAMTASDLARWDLALMYNKLLSEGSREAMTESVIVPGAPETNYGMGIGVETMEGGRLKWSHAGGVSGYISQNAVYPNEGIAIVVLTNTSGFRPSAGIAAELENLLLAPIVLAAPAPAAAPSSAEVPPAPPRLDAAARRDMERVRAVYKELQAGKPDRKQMTGDLSVWFSKEVVSDYASSLAPLGDITAVDQLHAEAKRGMVYRVYRVKAKGGDLTVASYFTPAGKLAQYTVYPKSAQ
ncbi:MAG: serine hydrolase domain-containing protein [Telluria sp.]|nr:serine hydrolase domain-containing protein [Telluria sp.]